MGKTIVCRCEDVTLEEIREAIDKGMDDIESIKRYLAIGTGPCQAKNCMVNLTRLLMEAKKQTPADLKPIVSRPPLHMTPLKLFAADKEEQQ